MKVFVIVLYCLFISMGLSAQNVGINADGSAPDASAMLDVKSSTKGFLPPRIALTATNSASPVTSPVAGLLVYNTATAGTAPNNVVPGYYYWNGAAWVVLVSSPVYTVGLNATLGGYVFFVTPDGKHGLVAETQDQVASVNWYNVQDFVSNPANHSTAGKNFTDWRMPTIYELNQMYLQKGTIGGFVNAEYFTGTPWDSSNAEYQNFNNGYQFHCFMSSSISVRAIRSF